MALYAFAIRLTKNPAAHEETDLTKIIKVKGLSDEAILDLVLVTFYFNFVNCMVLALGMELEEHKGGEYNIDCVRFSFFYDYLFT